MAAIVAGWEVGEGIGGMDEGGRAVMPRADMDARHAGSRGLAPRRDPAGADACLRR